MNTILQNVSLNSVRYINCYTHNERMKDWQNKQKYSVRKVPRFYANPTESVVLYRKLKHWYGTHEIHK